MSLKQKKTYFFIAVFSLLTIITLSSCNKSSKLDGSVWVGDCRRIINEKTSSEIGDSYSYQITTKGIIDGRLTIFFTDNSLIISGKMEGRVTKTMTIIFPDSPDLNQTTDYSSDEIMIVKGTGNYSCNNKKISINIIWKGDNEDDEDGTWTGSIDKNKMKLTNVFGETVVFTKK
jgi:hypothetical protein